MRASASVVWSAGLAIASIAVASCGGKVIRLGNATTGTGGGSATGMDGGGGADGSGTCQHGLVKANEVLFVGDSWVWIPGTQPLDTRVRDLARAAGAIGPTEDYVDLAAGGTTIATIASQYNTQEAGGTKVKVLVMDGGGWDTILAGGSDASVTGVVNTFTQHLAKVARDGTVRHIVYFLYPDLTIPGVAALRPGVRQACADSAVPCHFLNLQDFWPSHPEYTAANGIDASDVGANLIADRIWLIMQQDCIAQ